jgi:curved DNA-binding protein CbpA
MRRAPDERVVFALLGVDGTASWEQVRRAFRDAVRASHPDLHGGDAGAERRLKSLTVAWEAVNTPDKWAAYLAAPPGSDPSGGGGSRSRAPAVASLGRLRVQRQRSGSVGLRRWHIELDGSVVASIANGAITALDVEPGRHRVRIFYEWYSSRPLEIVLRSGQEIHLGCRQQTNPLLSLTAPKRSLALELLGSRRLD